MEIKVLIFDLGGVVFNCSFDKTFEKWSAITGKDKNELQRKFKFSENFEKFERGDITGKEYIYCVSQELNYNFSEDIFKQGWNDIYDEVIPEIDKLLLELKKTYRLVALTNTNAIHAEVWPGKYKNTLNAFERIFSSHEIRTRKPETKAFQLVLDYLKISPEQAIFLDDKQEYIDGAKLLGIKTILVTSYSEKLQRLNEFKILI